MESDLHMEQGSLRGNILDYVFSFLDVSDKQIMAQVCRYWKDVVYAPSLWQDVTAVLPSNRSESLVISLKKRQITRVNCSRSTDEELSFLFSQVPGLTHLEINDSRQVSHDFLEKNLTALTKLEHLLIRNCPRVSLERLYLNKSFAKVLKKLKSLKLPRKVSPEMISKLKNVEELDLKSDLNGECLESLACSCPKLQRLSFGFRLLVSDEELEKALRKLKKLKSLDLSWCMDVTGETIEIVADNLPELESLHFEHIQFLSHDTVTHVASKLKKLKKLSFSGMPSQGMICPCGCGYREDEEEDSKDLAAMLKELSTLKNLESLKFEVSEDEISESAILNLVKNLPKLKELKIKAIGKITPKQASQIASFLPNLRSLELVLKKKSQGAISICSKLKSLTSLDMSACRINDKDLKVMLGGLKSLESLTLLKNPGITDSGMQHLASLSSLTTLFLSGKVGDAGVAVLAEGLPQLKNLSLVGCHQIGDAGAKIIGQYLKKLQFLNAEKTKIGDEGFSFLCLNLPKLRTLVVPFCPITNQGIIDGAVGLGNLNSLEIGSKKMSNDGFQRSAKFLRGLTHLRIVNCHLVNKEGVISVLENLPSLTSLTFSGCGYICMQEKLVRPLCDAVGVDLTVIDVE